MKDGIDVEEAHTRVNVGGDGKWDDSTAGAGGLDVYHTFLLKLKAPVMFVDDGFVKWWMNEQSKDLLSTIMVVEYAWRLTEEFGRRFEGNHIGRFTVQAVKDSRAAFGFI